MEIIELLGSNTSGISGSNLITQRIKQDQRMVSAINILVNDSSEEEPEKLSLKIPTVRISSVIKKLEKLVAEEEFRKVYHERFNLLTKREIQVLKLLARGMNNPKISEQLFISRRTVEQHHKNLNKKLSIKSYADLIRYCQAFDLI